MVVLETLSDEELFELVKDSRRDAYEEIYHRFKGILYAHAYRMLGDREEVRDLLQEVFVALWSKREELLIRNVSAYLYSSIRNRVIDRASRHRSRNKYLESMSFYAEHHSYQVPDRILYEKELRTLIEKEVNALPERMQLIFQMSRKEHLSHKEIAEKLGISETTVRKQVNNALKILRSKFTNRDTFIFFLFIYSLPYAHTSCI
ncbi:RNA polymerase sigma-70 factor [Sphingobacterium sp. SGG-5]|uniref:RNA polymerase sigma factor n=1 Tax=Sphingobacterium sp. SGG-5 TaxID=2710881 RepID=UPI0013EA5AAF|nr:RNA polymerase sigma-70 factor [Sphingobacterium sp. SGG-5]NGM60675.1 RNA polymerase sigma-70 factor [Sphingobacterium sp. SGG-5]